jgi:murein DD-endopeptidase MepM/ murein hydrolase activator NlpD
VKTDALPAAPPARETPRVIDPRGPAVRPEPKDSPQVAAKQLEAFFLRQLLAEARPKGGGMLDGGFAGDTFKQMLDEAIADKMTAAGGIGMTAMFAKHLGKTDEAARTVPPIANAQLDPARIANALDPARIAHRAPHPDLDDAKLSGAPQFLVPVIGRATSGYGLRTDPVNGHSVNHLGFDVAAKAGTGVAAAARGTVVHAGPAGTYGNLVTLRHDNGFETRYAHLSSVDVKVGELVEAGADLGKVGSTGYSTGPHLHFEIRHEGKPIDPAPLLPLNSSLVRTTR